jgi:phospholipase C
VSRSRIVVAVAQSGRHLFVTNRLVLRHLQRLPVLDQDTTNLYANIASGWLPAVSFVKPSGLLDGHPATSKWDLYEGFAEKIIDLVKENPGLWDDTAIFVTADEGGGYYDSGYVQPVD